MKNYILGCDWGTSSFRLRLIRLPDQQLLSEVTSPEGVASTFNNWQKTGKSTGISRVQYFRNQLNQHVQRLAQKAAIDLQGIAIVISGMASSSIGMEEVLYATLPFPVDGSQASVKLLPQQSDFPHDSILVGGIRTEHDVMRGEETQLIGLLSLLDTQPGSTDESILIFPGTHSKHIYVKQEQVTNFRTFMTGEVFSLMVNHSILKDSVSPTERQPYTVSELAAFRSGVQAARLQPLLNSLFSVRTNQLFNTLPKEENAFYLSGLLIGSELATLLDQPQWKLILCCETTLYDLYDVALQTLHLSERATPVSASLSDEATIAGQVKIMQHQLLPISK